MLVAPDRAPGRLPFAALPGSKPGTYLLEEVALSVVPVPRLLPELFQLSSKGTDPALLLLGDVDFDAVLKKGDAAPKLKAKDHWRPLPATRGEILAIRDSFEQRFADGKVKVLRATRPRNKRCASSVPGIRSCTSPPTDTSPAPT